MLDPSLATRLVWTRSLVWAEQDALVVRRNRLFRRLAAAAVLVFATAVSGVELGPPVSSVRGAALRAVSSARAASVRQASPLACPY